MLNNRKFLKVSAYIGLLSIVSSNVAVAIPPKAGELYIHARKELRIVGAPPLLSVVEDISKVSHEDFDVTENCPPLMKQFGDFVWKSEKRKIRKWHLDTNIPYIGGNNPKVDYMALRGIPMFLALSLGRKLHPREQAGAQDFFEEIIKNQQKLGGDTQEIPDMDCLYYKNVGGAQHLFLRLSSETRKRAEIFNKESNGKTIYVEKGNAKLISDGNATLDHAEIKADNIDVEVNGTLLNRASKMNAKWIIRTKAGKQKNETIINKWVREDRGAHHFTHEEGVESVDDCVFVAEEVIQEGDEVENIGIFVEADKFEDRATHTSNMPAKITLYNYAWEEDDGLVSHAETSVKREDDVLVPTRYHVNYYKSDSSKPGSSVKYGYTLIDAGSRIEVLKDTKEDVEVKEEHTLEIHEEKDGFSFCGGVSVPDPTKLLQKIDKASSSGNMMGLTTSAISAVAKGIRAVNDYKTVKKLMNQKAPLGRAGASELLKVLSHFVNGPSIQFGSRSFDMRQKQTKTHGTTMVSPYMKFHNNKYSSFRGTYKGKEIDIKTGTFVTFDLPQTVESEMEMYQSGISMDLLTFAAMLIAPGTAGLMQTVMEAAMSASSISVSFEENKSRVEQHKPTVIQADKINIEADNGYLTQAQIKAGIVHAVFTNDLVLKTLANEKWQTREGGGMSFGLGSLVGFEALADTLIEAASSTSISSIDSGSFERIIDDFASMVGEEEFYLKVGNILRTESAFVGHKTHDPAHEHIEAKERHDVKVEESRDSWDNSFDLSIKDLTDTIGAIKQTVFDNAIEEGATTEEAVKKVQKVEKETREFLEKEEVKETVKEIKKINSELKKVEEKQKKLEEETPELKTMVKGLSENNSTIDSEKVDEYKKLQEQKEELTKEGLFATQFVYELTEDYANKHGWREEVKESLQQGFGKLCDFVSNVFDKITGENVEGMAAVRPIAKIALKAGARSKAGKEFIKFLVKELVKQGFSQTKINEIMTKLGSDPVDSKANTESFDEYDDISSGIFERSSKKPSTSASSRSNINSGGGSAMPPDPEKEPKKERKGTEGYKTGQTWENLKPVNKPEANRQIGKINKQAFGGGEMRTDGEKLYRFDNGHKNGKIHVEMYKKTSKGWQPYAECDPETGAILEGSLERMAEREPVRW